MATATTDYASLAALVAGLDGAPNYLDLSAWRAPYDQFITALKAHEVIFDSGSDTNRTGHLVGGGTFTMQGSGLTMGPGNTLTITQVSFTPSGGGNLQISGGNFSQPIKYVFDTNALTGRATQVAFSNGDQTVILFGNTGAPVTGTASFTVNNLSVANGTTLLQLEGSITINNDPLSANFLKPTGGTITGINMVIGANHIDASGLSIPALTFFNADTQPELEVLANLIFGGNNTHTAGENSEILIGGGGNDTYDFGSFNPGTASELPNGGTDLVKVQQSYTLDANIENATVTGVAGVTLTGNAIANKLTGGAGSDTLVGGGASDTMIGGGGDDTYSVDVAGDKVTELANGGTDTVLSEATTYVLAAEVEHLTLAGEGNISGTGNALANNLQGNLGDNKLDGAAGNDTISGGGGANTLLGGAGNDLLMSDNTADSIDGGAGNDTVIYAVSGSATLGAATENLTFTSSEGSIGTGNSLVNVMTSGAGADTLAGAGGNDTYNVQSSDTVLEAVGGGTDLVISTESFSLASFANVDNLRLVGAGAVTGTGNTMGNVLTSEGGAHLMAGGLGNDTFNLQFGDAVLEDADSSINGFDLVNASLLDGETFNLTVSGSGVEFLTLFDLGEGTVSGIGNDLNNLIRGAVTAGANNNLAGEDGNDTLIGGAGADTLDGCNGADSLVGGLGNDLFVFQFDNADGNLTLLVDALGDAGGADGLVFETIGDAVAVDSNTTISLAAAPLTALEHIDVSMVDLNSGTGGFNLIGNAAGNRLVGSDNADSLIGGAGNDTLDGGAGADTMIGGAGDDYYVYSGDPDAFPEEAVAGGLLDIIEFSEDVNYNVGGYTNFEGIVLNFAATLGGQANGTAGANFLGSKNGDHTLTGGLGNDTYSVQLGDVIVEDDNLVGSGHRDLVIATLLASDHYYNIIGTQIEDLTLILNPASGIAHGWGNELANKITGAANANNDLDGGGGADTLFGAAGSDSLSGNVGLDSLVGGLGNDSYYVLLKQTAIGVLEDAINDTGGIDSLILQHQVGATSFTYTLLATLENIDANLLDDAINTKITGNAANNFITGNGGNDTLDGAAGNDSIFGGEGSDSILGGAGADTLAGGFLGADTLDGGLGDDTYLEQDGDATYFISHAGDTIVSGENGGNDTVIVGATGNTAYLNISGITFLDNVTFTGTVGVAITGSGTDNSLKGGTGADTLDGGLGGDTLAGGNGNDYYIMAASDTITELAAGGTADTVESRKAVYDQLDNFVERLVLGAGAISGAGNTLNNLITGNSSGNMLKGGGGADSMTGGGGADIFVLDGIATGRVTTITDFVDGVDKIGLDMNVPEFAALWPGLNTGSFSAGSAPVGANAQLFYNINTGQLYYDGNGALAGQSTLIAVVAGKPEILPGDFVQFNGFT